MDAILRQLELDQSFFVQLVIIWIVFLFLSGVFFKPFQRLLEQRHQRTVADREAAQKLMTEAEQKFEEYKRRIAEERAAARKDYEKMLDEAKRQESEILSVARGEAKKISQEASESIQRQREEIRRQLEVDVESMAQQISQKLLTR